MLYRNTSNYGPGFEISPKLCGLGFHMEIKEEVLKIFLSQAVRARALIFGMYYLLVDLYQVYSCDSPEIKTSPAQGVTSWNIIPLSHYDHKLHESPRIDNLWDSWSLAKFID